MVAAVAAVAVEGAGVAEFAREWSPSVAAGAAAAAEVAAVAKYTREK